MSASALPTELWELICSFVPQKEVCRLRVLNRVFLSAALKIHYGTLVVQPDDPQVRYVFERRYALDNVHTLQLKKHVNPDVSSFKTPRLPFLGRGLFLYFPALLSTRHSWYSVAESLSRLRNVRHLHLEFGWFAPKGFFSIVFHNLCHNLVHLDLCFTYIKHFDPSWLHNSEFCPNVRSLGLSLDDRAQKYYDRAPFTEQTVLAIRSLVPSNIESLKLVRHSAIDPISPISLSFFNKLRKLTCLGFTTTRLFPFDIVQLVNTNTESLVDIQIDMAASIHKWGEQVHSLSLDGLRFFRDRHLCLPQLAKCHQLRTLRLNGMIRGYLYTEGVRKEQYEEFHQSILMALSGTALSLVNLDIPYLTLSFQRIWDIVYTFPNLDTLILIGGPDIQDLETNHLLSKVDYFTIARSAGVAFLNLQSHLCDIRKSAVGYSSSTFWQGHSEYIEEALASCCVTPPRASQRYDSY